MFNLNRLSLVKVVSQQPYLLTSSIDRNMVPHTSFSPLLCQHYFACQAISKFLSDVAGLSPSEVRSLLVSSPRIAMTAESVLADCWSLFTDLYGLSDGEARQACLRLPLLLSRYPSVNLTRFSSSEKLLIGRLVLKDIPERLRFFSEELRLPPPPFEDLQKLLLRFPQLMYLDTKVFLRPNLRVLRRWLSVDGETKEDSRDAVLKMVSTFPQFLGYNPTYLEGLCRSALWFLTSDESLLQSQLEDEGLTADDQQSSGDELEVDLIGDIARLAGSGRTDGDFQDSVIAYARRGRSLRLSHQKAVHILRSTPWIVSYRRERSQHMLAALAVSLGQGFYMKYLIILHFTIMT